MKNYNKKNYDVFYTASNDSDDSSELSLDASTELNDYGNTELDVEEMTDSNATLVPHCSQEEIAENNSVNRRDL